jgi:hypothetical protein
MASLMSYAIAMAENLLLIVALPWLVSDAARDLASRLDNRSMLSIPFCRSVAVACGGVLAIAGGVLAGIQSEIAISSLWDMSGFWHTGRFLVIVERYAEALLAWPPEPVTPQQFLFAKLLLASAALLAAVNFVIAVLGWRSLAALRGLMAHLVVSASVWLTLTVRGLAAIWVLHWLNFWALLILLIVLEMRRREEKATKLSF